MPNYNAHFVENIYSVYIVYSHCYRLHDWLNKNNGSTFIISQIHYIKLETSNNYNKPGLSAA